MALLTVQFLNAAEPANWNNADPFDRQLLGMVHGGYKWTSWITPELLPKAIQRLKQMREEAIPPGAKDERLAQNFDEALVALDDRETILRLIRDYHEDQGWGETVLEFNGRAAALSCLSEDLYTGAIERRKGNSGLSIRDNSANMMFCMIWQNQAFPILSRKWARSIYGYSSLEYERPGYDPAKILPVVHAMQQWWEHNKEAIEAKDYEKATWIPPDYPLSSYESIVVKTFKNHEEEMADARAKVLAVEKELEASKKRLEAERQAASKVSAPPFPERRATAERENLPMLWTGLVAVIMGIVFFLKWRKKMPGEL